MDYVLCVKCNKKIFDGEGRYNYPSGQECNDCGDPRTRKKSKFTKVAGYKLPTKLIEEYVEVVEHTRRAAVMGHSREDPLIVMNALNARVKIHTELLRLAGFDHEDMSVKAMKLRNALDKFLEKHIITPKQPEDWV